MMEFFIITLIVFFSTSSLIAFASRKLMGKGFTEFTVAGYRLGGFLSAMTYAATTYSAFMMVGLVGLSFATGVAALGFELVYLVATIGILVSVGPTIWMKARSRRWVSSSEMLGDLYGSKALASAIAILYLLALTPYLAAQFKGVGEIFQALGIDYTVGVTFMAITTFLWIAIAGIWSVATSDAFQGLWMIVTSIVLVTWIVMVMLPDSGLDVSRALVMLTNTSNGNILGFRWTINMFLGLSIPWIFFALTNPQVVQRLYIPRDIKAYRRMVRYFSIYGFIYTIVCVFLGLVFRSYVATSLPHLEKILISSRDSVTPTVLLYTHPILASTVFVGIVAAAISTSNSIVLSVASCIAKDLYTAYSKKASESRAILVTYISMVLMIAIASVIAIQRIAYIVELSVTSSAILIPIAPITLIGLYREPKRRGLLYAVSSLAIGLTIMVIAIIQLGPSRALTAPFIGAPAPLWCLIASSIPLLIMLLKNR